jgi:hypothetical protein
MVEHYKTSLVGFAIWTAIYSAIAFGLVKKNMAAKIAGIVLSILQTTPLALSQFPVYKKMLELFPSWYVYSLYASAGLGLTLLITLVTSNSRPSKKII